MKIILSRKGFDSQNGKMPSPIMPDGTLLSLPIPSKEDTIRYTELNYNGKSYYEIINELNPRTVIKEKWNCHLDPDIRRDALLGRKNWKPAFGQVDTAQTHLSNMKVGKGDLFLFFGWFRETEEDFEGKLKFKTKVPGRHILYGYLHVDEVISKHKGLSKVGNHPHSHSRYNGRINNSIYVASETLPFAKSLPGAGCLKYSSKLVLSKEGLSRSKWKLMDFFKDVSISYHSRDSFSNGYFQSAAIGQEFVIEENSNVTKWAESLFV